MLMIVFYLFVFLAAISTISILVIKDLFKAALLLLICLLSLAGIYAILYAEFLAVTQILIYAGGVVVLIIFGIMLTTRMTGMALRIENTNVFAGILASGFLTATLIVGFRDAFVIQTPPSNPGNTIRETGILLMTSHVLPFELAGILLLVALVGAAVVSTSTSSGK